MKWVTFISCLFLISFAESKHLPRRYRDVEINTIKHASELAGGDLSEILLILYSQQVQKATYAEVKKLVDDCIELAKKCVADEQSDPECAKPLHTVFLDEICHEQDLVEKYGFTECCGKVDPERNECFVSHKNATPGFITPYHPPDAEKGCKDFLDNKEETINHIQHEIARRHPFVIAAAIDAGTHKYEHILEDCCKAEDKNACFRDEVPSVRRALEAAKIFQKLNCHILKQSESDLHSLKLIKLAQKFPKAECHDLNLFATDIVHAYEECCKGHAVECLLARGKMIAHVCNHQEKFSPKLHDCCEKTWLERAECIITLENDDKPADLSPTVREFVEGEEVCQHYAQDKQGHLDKFTCEYAKRHPEFSIQLQLRLTKGYKNHLEKCCATEHPETCLPEGEDMLKKHVAETLEVVKKNCDVHSKLGDYLFQNELLVLYTGRAPQLEAAELLKYTKGLIDVANQCCNLDEGHKLKCAEEKTSLVLGSICVQHKEHHINKQICKCCNEPYDSLRECFSGLGVDPEYHAPPFDPERFHLHGDICTDKEEEAQRKKQTLLVNMLQSKPDITKEQLVAAIILFQSMGTTCCESEPHQTCFDTEFPKLIEQLRTDLGVN